MTEPKKKFLNPTAEQDCVTGIFTIPECAKMLGINVRTAYRWADRLPKNRQFILPNGQRAVCFDDLLAQPRSTSRRRKRAT